MKRNSKGTEKAWKRFPKPALSKASPYIGMDVAAKTQNPENVKATDNILSIISGGINLSLTAR